MEISNDCVGNVRSVSWILENNEREAIVVIRHFILANKCSVFVNSSYYHHLTHLDAYSGVFRIEQMQTYAHSIIFIIVVYMKYRGMETYFASWLGDNRVTPHSIPMPVHMVKSHYLRSYQVPTSRHSVILSPLCYLDSFLSLSIYYEPKCGVVAESPLHV